MELVETLEINGEEREIADAVAREQINASNVATVSGMSYSAEDDEIIINAKMEPNATVADRVNWHNDALNGVFDTMTAVKRKINSNIDGINSNLVEQKMLGWSVPSECPIQNEVSGNQFIQKVGRVDLGSLSWNKRDDNSFEVYRFLTDVPMETKTFGTFCHLYSNSDWAVVTLNAADKCITLFSNNTWGYASIAIRDRSYTNADTFKNAMQGVYLYYELETPITTQIDGNEAVTKVNDSLDTIGKCKNLLKPTLATTTVNGITCTNNGDGTFTLNGTASADATFEVRALKIQEYLGKTLKLVGCPKNGSATTYYLFFTDNQNNNSVLIDFGKGDTKTVEQWGNSQYWTCNIRIPSGITVSNLVFKPMLTTNLSATYDDFVPYTGDGETLTEDVADLKNDLSKQCKKDDITTNETLIGTFNGKNYYRKLFTGISGSGGSVTVNVGEKIEIYNYYGRAYVYGQSGASNAKYPIPNKNYYIDSQNASETSFQLTIPTSSDTRKIDLVIEYTKVDE